MAFKPQLKYNSSLSTEDNLKAIINWLNFLLREMTTGRVPQNKEDTTALARRSAEQDEALAIADETAIELFETQMTQEDKINNLYNMIGGK